MAQSNSEKHKFPFTHVCPVKKCNKVYFNVRQCDEHVVTKHPRTNEARTAALRLTHAMRQALEKNTNIQNSNAERSNQAGEGSRAASNPSPESTSSTKLSLREKLDRFMVQKIELRDALRKQGAHEDFEAIECTNTLITKGVNRQQQRQTYVGDINLKRQKCGQVRRSIQKKTNPATNFKRGVDFVGLKIRASWLNRMCEVQPGFQTVKTIECRSYPPTSKLRIGDTFYLLCSGEVWACATLDGVRVYRSPAEFKEDTASHHITKTTCDHSGPKSYESFMRAFNRGCKVVFGYVLSQVKFFSPRPRSAQLFAVGDRVVNVPHFFGQRYGKTFATCFFPKLHDLE